MSKRNKPENCKALARVKRKLKHVNSTKNVEGDEPSNWVGIHRRKTQFNAKHLGEAGGVSVHKWLVHKVGNKWDDVYSEYSKVKEFKSHKSEARLDVELNTRILGGVILDSSNMELPEGQLFVHPLTGILCQQL